MDFLQSQKQHHWRSKQHAPCLPPPPSTSSSSSSKRGPPSTTRRLTQDQVRLLERTFASNKKLDPEMKLRLARELGGVQPRQVAIWYQNRRARWRTQTLELDCAALRVKLDDALGEKRRLEHDVHALREELRMAREMLSFAGGNSPDDHHPHYQAPGNVEEALGGSCVTRFNERECLNWRWDVDEGEDRLVVDRHLRVDEYDLDCDVYDACWMATNSGADSSSL